MFACRRGGPNCGILALFAGKCFAIAAQHGRSGYGWAVRNSVQEARNFVMTQCLARGLSRSVKVSFCDTTHPVEDRDATPLSPPTSITGSPDERACQRFPNLAEVSHGSLLFEDRQWTGRATRPSSDSFAQVGRPAQIDSRQQEVAVMQASEVHVRQRYGVAKEISDHGVLTNLLSMRPILAAIVARLRVPERLPAGLPFVPFGNGRPRWRCFSAAFAAGMVSPVRGVRSRIANRVKLSHCVGRPLRVVSGVRRLLLTLFCYAYGLRQQDLYGIANFETSCWSFQDLLIQQLAGRGQRNCSNGAYTVITNTLEVIL
jgi:hypothetical protein